MDKETENEVESDFKNEVGNEAEPVKSFDGESAEMIVLKQMQKQLEYLERKVDTLIEKSGDRGGSKRRDFSRPYRPGGSNRGGGYDNGPKREGPRQERWFDRAGGQGEQRNFGKSSGGGYQGHQRSFDKGGQGQGGKRSFDKDGQGDQRGFVKKKRKDHR